MINLNPVRKTAFSFLTMLLLVNAAALGADNELLKIVPADSLFYLQVNNFDYTLSQTDQFLSGTLPIPMGVQMSLRMGLAHILGNPSLEGVNTSGSFAVSSMRAAANQWKRC